MPGFLTSPISTAPPSSLAGVVAFVVRQDEGDPTSDAEQDSSGTDSLASPTISGESVQSSASTFTAEEVITATNTLGQSPGGGLGSQSGLSRSTLIGIIVGVSAFALILLLITFVAWIRYRRKKSLNAGSPRETYNEKATNRASAAPSHQRGASTSTYDKVSKRSPSPTKQNKMHGSGPTYHSVGQQQSSGTTPMMTLAELGADDTPMSSPIGTSVLPSWRNSAALSSEQDHRYGRPHSLALEETQPLDPFSSGYIPPPSPDSEEFVIVEGGIGGNSRRGEIGVASNNVVATQEAASLRRSSIDTARPSVDGVRGGPISRIHTKDTTEGGSQFPVESSSSFQRGTHRSNRSLDSTSSFRFPMDPQTRTSHVLVARASFDNPPLNAFRQSTASTPLSPILSADTHETALHPMAIATTLGPRVTPPQSPRMGHKKKDSLSSIAQGSPIKSGTGFYALDSYHERVPSRSEAHIPLHKKQHSGSSFSLSTALSPKKVFGPTHARNPSSPTKNPSSFFNRHRSATSATSIQHQHQHEYEQFGVGASAPHPTAKAPTMTEANVYDFDIYRERSDEGGKVDTPPDDGDLPPPIRPQMGDETGYKRFSASMSDLPRLASPSSSKLRQRGGISSYRHKQGRESQDTTQSVLHSPPPTLYISRQALEGGSSHPHP